MSADIDDALPITSSAFTLVILQGLVAVLFRSGRVSGDTAGFGRALAVGDHGAGQVCLVEARCVDHACDIQDDEQPHEIGRNLAHIFQRVPADLRRHRPRPE